jgi:predicted nucleic acid-binding protein
VADALVVDASAVVRALSPSHRIPEEVTAIAEGAARGHAPDLIVAEIVSALAVYVRAGARSLDEALAELEIFASLPLQLHDSGVLAASALERAATTLLSGYDALYAVLAETLEVPLVTADRGLARAVSGSRLVE